MAETPTARSLMTRAFARLGTGHSLHEAIAVLLDPVAQPRGTHAVVIVGPEGAYVGSLTYRAILSSLRRLFDAVEGEPDPAEPDRDKAREALAARLEEVADKNIPTVNPDTPLASLLWLVAGNDAEFFPVIEENRVVGVVLAGDVFKAAADIALTPETSGINLP